MRRCHEKPTKDGYHCGNGVTVNGVRYCSEYGIAVQIAYKGHTFCADLGEDEDENQLTMEETI